MGEEKSGAATGQAAAAKASGGSYRIALAGNPNCGKTTLFNTYTGAHQHVGNYPGVTVDRKEGDMTVGNEKVTLVDIPGTYSLTAYSQEELVARAELSFGRVEAVVDIADSSALDRNLLLTLQMREMGMPVVLACNMMDEARKAGISIDMKKLSSRLGSPCMPLVAKTGEGAKEILETALALAKKGRLEPLVISYGPEIDRAVAAIDKIVAENKLLAASYPSRWTAIKLLEGDTNIKEGIAAANPEAAKKIAEICAKADKDVRAVKNISCESAITDARFGYIRGLLADGVVTTDPHKDRLAMTDKIDRVLTNALLGPLVMIGVIYVMFWITFSLGAYPQGWVEDFFAWLGDLCTAYIPEGDLQSLVVDGIIGGVGGVLSFVPLIAIMFLQIAFIEDSGYMARIAYMMDRIFRFFGLHGASVMPYIVAGGIAGGCAVPGAMATRTLRSQKEKLATLLTMPYMVCGAKVPVMLLLIGAFFPDQPAFAFFLILLAGWLGALLVSLLLRSTIIRGEGTPFVMELPPYRMPTVFALCLHCWERSWMYIKKAGTIILAISVLIWAGVTYPGLSDEQNEQFDVKVAQLTTQQEGLAEDSEAFQAIQEKIDEVEGERSEEALRSSYVGRIGVAIEPVTKVLGFYWRTNIALVAGVAAKEAVVSTLGTTYSMGADVDAEEDAESLGVLMKNDPNFNKATALALMLFVLMYSPCFVALVVIKSEAGGWRWLVFSLVFNTLVAFVVAFVAYNIGLSIWGAA